MKILIVYYSRTKTTKIVAKEMAEKLGADAEELIDKKDRSGGIGYMAAGRDALKKRLTELEEHKFDPANYDLVILGTPVWVGTMSAAIRTYVEKHKEYFKAAAFFSTQGSSKRQRVFDDLKAVSGLDPVAEEYFTTKEVRQDQYREKLYGFIEKLN